MKQSKIIKYLFLFFTFIVNNIFAQNIFEKKYDSVYFKTEYFIIAKEKKVIKLFNTKGESYPLKKYITIAEIQPNVAYQIVLGDKLKKINGEGRFDDSVKVHFERGVCGTVNRYRRIIITRNDSTFINYHTTYPYSTIDLNEDVDSTTNVTIFVDKNIDLYFLNGTKFHNSDGNDFYQAGLESNIYIEKVKKGMVNLLRIKNIDSAIEITIILNNVEVPFNKTIDGVPAINHQVFIFKMKNKFGYYPMQTNAKYKSLSVFNINFAAFTLPNGQKGWLDINGKEYFY